MDDRRIVHNLKLFLTFNQRKLNHIMSLLPERKRWALSAVPTLLHVNIRTPKGPLAVVPKDAPAGIRYLAKPQNLNDLWTRTLAGAELPPGTVWGLQARDLPIRSLLLMGSLGSVGQTAKSDFDFWVVIRRQKIGSDGWAALAAKCQALSQWLEASAAAESTFFLTDLDDVRVNRFGETAGESAGSALAALLKEEFYRSLTLLGGQAPWWWILPSGLDDDGYQRVIEALKQTIRFDPNQMVDLGNLTAPNPDEFFGASLWEIQKSLNSPFKSAMKMALVEAYAQSGGQEPLVAEHLKRRVLEKNDPLPDPYLLMFDRVSEYLAGTGRQHDLETVRLCLYLKSNPRLSGRDLVVSARLTDRKAVFAKYVKDWGWDKRRLETLSFYKRWSFSQRLALGDRINQFILSTYRRLSEAAKASAGGRVKIDPVDLTAMGRRLTLYFSRKPERVSFLPNLLEDPEPLGAVTLAPIGRAKDCSAMVWEAYDGAVEKPRTEAKLIRTLGLPHLLAWLGVNGLAHKGTMLYLILTPIGRRCTVSLPEIQQLFATILDLFGNLRQVSPSREDLIRPARIVDVLLVPNLENPDFENNLQTLGILYHTSWGELCSQEAPDGETGLKMVRELLVPVDPTAPPAELAIHLPKRPQAEALAAQIRKGLSGAFFRMR